ncbi:HD-GYP domain-containing protein [Kosmotoga pacifica]|uniref:HD-GYP domain-containing protein n=1 Tax=Kosmotoga pacifica TaxID=1330330 RepID=A0A0G2Z7T5_9BACT|nr:HD domain-containing phosphohydrolase [Kosmotoga pacifica]AKI97612.1 hypothetical protein IX53_07030 [Kosmotoga pacifica]
MESNSFRVFCTLVLVALLTSALFMFHVLATNHARDFEQMFQKTIYLLAYSSKDVFRSEVVEGRVEGIPVSRLIGDRSFAISPGIFVSDDSVKLTISIDGKTEFVEIPEKLISKEVTFKHKIWFVVDRNTNIVLSSNKHTRQLNWLFFENGKIYYIVKIILNGDYTLYFGTLVPWHFILALFGLIVAFLISSSFFKSYLRNQEEQIKNLRLSLDHILHEKEVPESVPEEVKAVEEKIRKLREEVSASAKEIENLKQHSARLSASLNFEKEMCEKNILNILKTFGTLIEENVHPAGSHMEEMIELAKFIAQEFGIKSEEEFNALQIGIMLHDIGLIEEGRKKNEIAFETRRHTLAGERIGKIMGLSPLAKDIIKHHHEAYDGTGFPDGLKGEGISLRVRIASAVIAYFEEKYEKGIPKPIEKMKKSGKYDPKILDIIERWLSK